MAAYSVLDQTLGVHPYLGVFLGITLLLLLVIFGSAHRHTSKYPLAGIERNAGLLRRLIARLTFFKNGPRLIPDSYEKYKDTIVELPTLDRRTLVLPPKYLGEMSHVSNSIASVSKSTSDFFVGGWTTLDLVMFGHAGIDTLRAQYISNIGAQVYPAAVEIRDAMHEKFEEYSDWTSVASHPLILNAVAQAVARTVIGEQECRNAKWKEAVIGYGKNIFMAAMFLKMTPWPLRPLTALFTPFVYRIHAHRRTFRNIAIPIIKQRLLEYQASDQKLKASQKTSVDWLIEISPPEEKVPDSIVHRLAGISFGATHTTTNTVFNAVLDLAAHFDEYAPALREEIDREIGPDITTATTSKLSKMWKLDSFLKESQRFHPVSILSVNRTVITPLRLSSDDVIQPGTHICFSGLAMSLSDKYLDHAATFDGFRFERMRRDKSVSPSGLQFTSASEPSLHFGYGRGICPGRFMGSTISKLVMISLLQRYDFRLKDGENRPKNINLFDSDIPNADAEILFRDRVIR